MSYTACPVTCFEIKVPKIERGPSPQPLRQKVWGSPDPGPPVKLRLWFVACLTWHAIDATSFFSQECAQRPLSDAEIIVSQISGMIIVILYP
jgi:hypothetical protein